jgi:UTP--glucose-1-phosphate uridylyltransferase
LKGIIVAAGYGSRFLPITKTIPKEMLPLIDRPAIDFIVEEFKEAGIRDIVVISSRRKKALEDWFDREVELEGLFEKEGKRAELEKINPDAELSVAFVRQQRMLGTGHALLQVRPFIGDGPCVVAYPDDIVLGPSLSKKLIQAWQETGCSVMASEHIAGDVSRYGVLNIGEDNLHVRGIVEKPAPGLEPSHEISLGRYLFTPEFFKLLEFYWQEHLQGPDAQKEYYHIKALNQLMAEGKVVHSPLEGQRLDTGEPAGYLEAILCYAMQREDLQGVLKKYHIK